MPRDFRLSIQDLNSEDVAQVKAIVNLFRIITNGDEYIHCNQLRKVLSIGEKRMHCLKKLGFFKEYKPKSFKEFISIIEVAVFIVKTRNGHIPWKI